MNCDRLTVRRGKAQVGFLKFLVTPLYTALESYDPKGMRPMVERLKANLSHFEQQADKEAEDHALKELAREACSTLSIHDDDQGSTASGDAAAGATGAPPLIAPVGVQ